MDNQNQNFQNKEQKDVLEPIVLGTVKKGKTGKPLVAVLIILLIASLIYFLPVIGSYFGERSIIDLITRGELIDFIKNKNNKVVEEPTKKEEFVLVGSDEKIDNGNLIISNIKLKDNVFSYNIKSKTATYDATKEDLYLQIFVDKKTLVYTKAIDEIFMITEKSVLENVTFYKESDKYYVKLSKINYDDIDDINLSSDESGLASIICSKDNDQYEYIFQNKELIGMKRTYKYKYNDDQLEDYQKALFNYRDLMNERAKYQIKATVLEDSVGFTYSEDIKLDTADVSSLGNNYYPYKYTAKVILFKQEAKGFDCE